MHTRHIWLVGFLPISTARLPSLSAEVELSKPAARRSRFFNVLGTMGCFFLDHCCILVAPLPFGPLSYTIHRDRKLWQSWPTFSANQRPEDGGESLSKSLSLTNSVFSSFFFLEKKKSLIAQEQKCLQNNEMKTVYFIVTQLPKWKFTWPPWPTKTVTLKFLCKPCIHRL